MYFSFLDLFIIHQLFLYRQLLAFNFSNRTAVTSKHHLPDDACRLTFVYIITSGCHLIDISSSIILEFIVMITINSFDSSSTESDVFLCGALLRRRKSSSDQYSGRPQLHATIGSNGTENHQKLLCSCTGAAGCDYRIRLQWAHNPIYVWKQKPNHATQPQWSQPTAKPIQCVEYYGG